MHLTQKGKSDQIQLFTNSSLISGPHDRLTQQRHNGCFSPWNNIVLLWNASQVPGGHSPFSKQSLPGNKRSICVICQQCARSLKAERWCGKIAFTFSPRGESYTIITSSHWHSYSTLKSNVAKALSDDTCAITTTINCSSRGPVILWLQLQVQQGLVPSRNPSSV